LLVAAGSFLAASLALSMRRAATSPIQSETHLLKEDDRKTDTLPSDEASQDRRDFLIHTRLILPALLFVTGFIAITLEVLWSRALDQVLSGSVYSCCYTLPRLACWCSESERGTRSEQFPSTAQMNSWRSI
jgi:hypothetical protein